MEMWLLWLSLMSFVVYSLAEHNDIHTVKYTKETFPVEVPKKNHFVMFYAPWCGHCNRLAPTWDQLAEKFNKDDSEVTIAKVDCTADTELCSDHDVTGYPTLKLFKTDHSDAVRFRGTRDMASLSTFIKEQLGTESEDIDMLEEDYDNILLDDVFPDIEHFPPPDDYFLEDEEDDESEPAAPKPVDGLVELTDETFTDHVASGKHFVKFYAPWCGHCQKLAPTWDVLAQSLQYSTTVKIAKVDCTVQREVCNNFDIKGYPTLLWIEDGKKVEKYQGQRTLESLKTYVSEKVGSTDTETKEKMSEEGDNASPVVVLSGENFDHGIAKGVSFIKFFAPWCGHCKRLAPTWDELGKKFTGHPTVKIVKVDCTNDQSKDLCNQQEVDGFPTLFLYKDGKKVAEYNGSRGLDDLYQFVMKHIQHDEL